MIPLATVRISSMPAQSKACTANLETTHTPVNRQNWWAVEPPIAQPRPQCDPEIYWTESITTRQRKCPGRGRRRRHPPQGRTRDPVGVPSPARRAPRQEAADRTGGGDDRGTTARALGDPHRGARYGRPPRTARRCSPCATADPGAWHHNWAPRLSLSLRSPPASSAGRWTIVTELPSRRWVLPKRPSRIRWVSLDEAVEMIAPGEAIARLPLSVVYRVLTPIWLIVGKGAAVSLGDAASFLRGDATFLRAARGLGGAANGRRRGSGVAQ